MKEYLMNDIIDYLMDIIDKYKINVRVADDWLPDWQATSCAEINLIIYNPNYEPAYERPIHLAHEIGHVLARHPLKNPVNTYTCDEEYEEEANRIALGLILDYIQDHDLTFETKQQLIECFAIPDDMVYSMDRMMVREEPRHIYQYCKHRPNWGRIILGA